MKEEANGYPATVLWVEDQARQGSLLNCTQELEKSDDYQLTIVRDATVAEEIIGANRFDIVVLDIRIPPGMGIDWEGEHTGNNHRLGLKLFERIYPKISSDHSRYGFITVEKTERVQHVINKIDPLFNVKKQYIRKGELVFGKHIIHFLQNLK